MGDAAEQKGSKSGVDHGVRFFMGHYTTRVTEALR